MGLSQSVKNITLAREPRWSYHPRKYTSRRAIPPGAKPSPNQSTWEDLGLESSKKWKADESAKPELLPPSSTRNEAKKTVRKELGITNERPIAVIRTPLGLVKVDEGFIKHLIDDHKVETREKYIRYIKRTLEDPQEIWLTELELNGYPVGFRDHYISMFVDEKKRGIVSVVERDKLGGLLWTAWNTDKLNTNRKGLLKYKKDKLPKR